MNKEMLIGIKKIITTNSIKLIEPIIKLEEANPCKVESEKKETLGITIST